MPDRLISLAAGSLLGADPLVMVAAAAGAGFDAVGFRPDPDNWGDTETRAVAAAVDASGLAVLDIEVVRIGTHPLDHARRLIEIGVGLRARHLLVVSDHPDPARTADEFALVAGWASAAGIGAVLEFMRFTGVHTLAEALEVVRRSGVRGAGVLVDALHLHRSGGRPVDVAGVDPALLPYAQICDAPARAADDPAHEARHCRLPPGEGELPLGDLVAALPPALAVSLEVQSDRGRERRSPAEWAGLVLQAGRRVLDRPTLDR